MKDMKEKKSSKKGSPDEETLRYHNEYLERCTEVRDKLVKSVEDGDILDSEKLLPKETKKNGQAKRPVNCNLLFSNQLNGLGMLQIADDICERYHYSKQRKMGIARKIGSVIWKEIPDETKEYFLSKAKEVDELHKEKYPTYKLIKGKKRNNNLVYKPYNYEDKKNKPKRTKQKKRTKTSQISSEDNQRKFQSVVNEVNEPASNYSTNNTTSKEVIINPINVETLTPHTYPEFIQYPIPDRENLLWGLGFGYTENKYGYIENDVYIDNIENEHVYINNIENEDGYIDNIDNEDGYIDNIDNEDGYIENDYENV